jgi:DNA-binding MarR family transcriptional regulator
LPQRQALDVSMSDRGTKNHSGALLHDLFKEVFALHATLSRMLDSVHAQTGLSTPERKILQSLERLGSATVPEVAARLGVSRQSVQVVCNDLLSRGYIAFFDNPRHKRSKLAGLTEAGTKAYHAAQQNEYAAIEQALGDIDPQRAERARELLATIRKALG